VSTPAAGGAAEPRLVVVTGAGSGIGRATAVAFGRLGDRVVLAGRREEFLALTAGEVDAAGGKALAVPTDVTVEADLRALVERAADWGDGRVDVVVCAAGGTRVGPFTDLGADEFDDTIRSTLTGTFLACKHAVGHMTAGGRLVVLSSIAGRSGFPEWSAYSAAKFGVLGFAEAIRGELRGRGIRVTAIIPGAVDTPLWRDVPGEWNRANMLQPDDVARSIVHVCGEPEHVSTDEVLLGHIAGAL
jgi:NAD(P)-dependent dehydrogenase (short-subunit alcohol dehydrogenase family)